MIDIDVSKWKQTPPPYKHQIEGVKLLLKNPAFMLGDRPRTMKSRQVVDAACTLFEAGLIDVVLVVARLAGRGVWGNSRIGQIKRWSWVPVRVHEFHQKRRDLWKDENSKLLWVVTNYDYMRSDKNLAELMESLSQFKAPWVVFDESQRLGNEGSLQSKAAMKLCWDKEELKTQDGKYVLRRRWQARFSRRTMLTGTPGGPLKQWSQFNVLNHVFDRKYKSVFSFKCVYGDFEKEGFKTPIRGVSARRDMNGKVIPGSNLRLVHRQNGWKNLDKLSKITAPYARMLERKDCPGVRDVPVNSTFEEVRLSKETWRLYRELKRDAIAELSTGETYVSPNKGVCLVRLSQICNGHLGGFEEGAPVRWLSNEKINWLIEELTDEDCKIQNVIVWCRFVPQRKEVAQQLFNKNFLVYQIYGSQNKLEREAAQMIFSEGTERPKGVRIAVVAQQQAGGDSNDFAAASDVYRMSDDWSWENFYQSNERPLGPAQKAEFVSSTDVVATGPNGERTMDHIVLEAREEGRQLEKLTCQEWIRELQED